MNIEKHFYGKKFFNQKNTKKIFIQRFVKLKSLNEKLNG